MLRTFLLLLACCGLASGERTTFRLADDLEARCRELEQLQASRAIAPKALVERCHELEWDAARSLEDPVVEEILWRTRLVRIHALLGHGRAHAAADLGLAALERSARERVQSPLRERLRAFRVPVAIALLASGRQAQAQRVFGGLLGSGANEEGCRSALAAARLALESGYLDAADVLLRWMAGAVLDHVRSADGSLREAYDRLRWEVHLARGHALQVLADEVDESPSPSQRSLRVEALERTGRLAEASCTLREGAIWGAPAASVRSLVWIALLEGDPAQAMGGLASETVIAQEPDAYVLAQGELFESQPYWPAPVVGWPATPQDLLLYMLACAHTHARLEPARALAELAVVLDEEPPHRVGRLALEEACRLLLEPKHRTAPWRQRLWNALLAFGGAGGALPRAMNAPREPFVLAYCVTPRSVFLVRFRGAEFDVFDLGWRQRIQESVSEWNEARGADRKTLRESVRMRILPERLLDSTHAWALVPDRFLWRVPFQELVLRDELESEGDPGSSDFHVALGLAPTVETVLEPYELEFIGFGSGRSDTVDEEEAPETNLERPQPVSAELRAVAVCFPADRQRVVHGREARLDVLTAGDVASDMSRWRPRCRVLHLQLEGRLGGFEGPVLRLPAIDGTKSRELAGESLVATFQEFMPRADLVVLSIRDATGSGAEVQRAMTWLAQVVLDAGARSVLVGSRTTDDVESSLPFGWFYEGLSRGLTVFEAWRASLERLRDEGRDGRATLLLFGRLDTFLQGIDPPDLSRLQERVETPWTTYLFWIGLAIVSAWAGFVWGRRRRRPTRWARVVERGVVRRA